MNRNKNLILVIIIVVAVLKSSQAVAEVYGGGYWEVIGLGNMQCAEFNAQTDQKSYKELVAVWLSGFMSGVNFGSEDVYDITWGEDVYVLTDLVIARCEENSEKLLSDIATQIVYTRYQDENFTPTKDIKN